MTKLADLFVEIRPDAAGFSSELKTKMAAVKQSVDVVAKLDRSAFNRALTTLRADMQQLSVVRTTLQADTAQVTARLKALRAELASLDTKVEIDGSTAEVVRRVAEVKAQIKALGDTKAQLGLDTRAANAQLNTLKARLKAFGAAETDHTVDVNVTGERGINFAFRGVSNLTTAMVSMGPAVLPVLAAVTAGVGVLGSSLLSAGGAGGAFGASVAGTVALMKDAQEEIKAETTQLAAMTKADEDFAKQQRLVNDLMRSFNQTFGPAAKGLDNVKNAWSRFIEATSPVTTRVMGDAMNVLADNILPKLVPVSDAAGRAVGRLVDQFGEFTDSARFDGILNFFQRRGPSAIGTFGRSAGNVLLGVFELFRSFAPFQRSFERGMESGSRAFLGWAKNLDKTEGFQRFMAYVRRVLPDVAAMFGELTEFVGKFLAALGPLAGAQLKALTGIFRGLNQLSPETLHNLAVGVVAVVVGLKAWEIAAKAAAVGQALLNSALLANPFVRAALVVGALTAALVVAYKKSDTFRGIVNKAWAAVKDGLQDAWRVVEPILARFRRWLTSDLGPAITRFWREDVKPTFKAVAGYIEWAWRAIRPIFEAQVKFLRGPVADTFGWLWKNVVKPVFRGIWETIKTVFGIVKDLIQAGLAVIRGDWKTAWDNIKEALARTWDLIRNLIRIGADAVRSIMSQAWDAVKSGTRDAWDAVKEAIRNTWDGIKGILGGVKDFLVDKVVGAFGFAVGKIKDIWNKLIEIALKPVNFFIGTVYNDGIRAVFNKIAGFLPGDTAELSAFPPLGKARGGPIPGHSPSSTADNIPVWTTAREWVIRQQSSDRLNRRFPGFLAHLNETGSPEGYRPPRSVSTPGGDPGDFGLAKGGEVSPQMRSRFAAGLRFFQRAMVGKPYSWGGAGPGGFDCSGAMSALARYIMGHRPPWGRLGTSASAPNWPGFARGSGSMFNVGYAANYRGSGVGHVAGTLLGTNVESAGGVGVRMGGSARGANDPGFNGIMHLGPGGAMAGGAQGSSVFSGIARAVLRATRAAIKAIKEDINSPHLAGSNRLNRGLRGGGDMAVEGLTKLLAKAQASGGSGGGGGATGLYKGDHSGLDRASPAVAQAYARKMLPKYGWKPGQFAPLKNLWNKESGWRWNADNPSSTAYGIPQSKPGSKMAASGSDWRTNAGTQVDWGLGYIKGRYGAPTGAWGHSQNVGWYDQGGVLRDGGTAKNRSGKPEAVLTAEQWRDIRKLIAAVFVGHKPSAITPDFIAGQLDGVAPTATQLKKRYGEAMRDYREQLEQAKGAREALNQAERRAKNLGDAIDKARKAGHKDHMKELKERRDEIQKLVRQRDRDFDKQKRQASRAEEAAKKAAKLYADAQRAAIEQAKTVAGSVTGLGSLANSPFRSSAGIVGNLRRSILVAKDWGSVVKNLIKAGLRGPILQEFIAEGPSFEAVALGRNLLRAGDIDEIVALQDRLARIGREVGGIAVSDPRRGGGGRAGQAIDRARTGTGTRERRSTIDRLEVHFHGVYDTPAAMAQELGAELARKGIY